MNDITSLIARTVANSFTPAAIQNVSPGLLLLRGSIAVVLGNELPKNTALPSDIKKVVSFGTPPEDRYLARLPDPTGSSYGKFWICPLYNPLADGNCV